MFYKLWIFGSVIFHIIAWTFFTDCIRFIQLLMGLQIIAWAVYLSELAQGSLQVWEGADCIACCHSAVERGRS